MEWRTLSGMFRFRRILFSRAGRSRNNSRRATLIAQGQADDAAPVTRRAIEIGHLAIAVHLDSGNYVKWLDAERRKARWKDRRNGKRPKSEPAHKWGKEVVEHPLLAELRTTLGMLSDSDAHFTPEHEGNLQWT